MNVKGLRILVLLIVTIMLVAVFFSYTKSMEISQPIKEDVYCLTKVCVIHNDMTECISTGGQLTHIRVEKDDLVSDHVTLEVSPSTKFCK